jgi:hypothetical protein
VVLHRKNPAVRKMPVFEGLFRCRKSVAEREGFSAKSRGHPENIVKQGIPEKSGEGLRPPLCTT